MKATGHYSALMLDQLYAKMRRLTNAGLREMHTPANRVCQQGHHGTFKPPFCTLCLEYVILIRTGVHRVAETRTFTLAGGEQVGERDVSARNGAPLAAPAAALVQLQH